MEESHEIALEEAFIEALDASDAYIKEQAQLQALLKEGFFGLAKARYSMGSHRIGISQFNAHMTATSLVSLGNGPECPRFSALELDWDRATSRQNEHASARTRDFSEEESRRKDGQGDTSYSSIILDLEQRFVLGCDQDDPSWSSSQAVRTPIQMMGGLVSPHLLEAQAKFSEAYKAAIRVANSQVHLDSTLQQYSKSNFKELHRDPEADRGIQEDGSGPGPLESDEESDATAVNLGS
ncbi:probable coiled-coil domain-containing protein 115 [Coccomyxa sp. Obi]|nr:probable coiled-coil domain-containing protein 115 [Coccomyxa sp. Obi]